MPACQQGTAPVRGRPWAAICEVGQREDGCRLAMREQPHAGSEIGHLRVRDRRCRLARREQPHAGSGIGHLRVGEEGCRLAAREQPQRVHDRGQEWAISGRGKSDAGLRAGSSSRQCATMERNQRSQGQGRGVCARRMICRTAFAFVAMVSISRCIVRYAR